MLRFRLIASSFSPMMLIVAIRMTTGGYIVSAFLLALAIISLISLALLLRARSSTNSQPHHMVEVENENNQVPAYLLTYVFPFVGLAVNGWQDVVAFTMFFIVLLVILLRTSLVLVNPILLACGYHLYNVRSSSGFEGLVLSKKSFKPGQTIYAVSLGSGALKLQYIDD